MSGSLRALETINAPSKRSLPTTYFRTVIANSGKQFASQ